MEISAATLYGAYLVGFSTGRAMDKESLSDVLVAKELKSLEPSTIMLKRLAEIGYKMSDKKKSDDSAR